MSPSRVVISCLAMVAGAAVAIVAMTLVEAPPTPAAEFAADVRADFVHRWEGWRRATVAFTETTTRRTAGRELTTSVQIVQRFPDRIIRDGADLSARLGSRLIGCTDRPGTTPTCVDNGGYRPDDELAAELAAWTAAVGGPDATYRLSRTRPTCFRARHVGTDLIPPWGDRFDVCFDPETGVATSEVTRTGSLTVTVTRSDLRRSITTADVELPAEPTPAPTD